MSKICENCIHWSPSYVKGKCLKDHGDTYGIEMCNYCADYQTSEQARIAELLKENKELRDTMQAYGDRKIDNVSGILANAVRYLDIDQLRELARAIEARIPTAERGKESKSGEQPTEEVTRKENQNV